MDGFRAFQYYTALKLHFTTDKYNVFVSRGRVNGSYNRFQTRNDKLIFERLARQFNDKSFIQYIASNFMYGNPDVIYNPEQAILNHKEFIRRKQSITQVFTDDLATIINSGASYEFSSHKIPDVIQLLFQKRITIESIVILNSIDSIVDKMKSSNHINLLLGDDIRRIEKSNGFFKWDKQKVMTPYLEFMEDIKGNIHG